MARGATQGLVKSYPMAAPALSLQNQNAARVADPALREGLLKYARRRLPPGEVEDLVQSTLTEALVADNAPSDPTSFRRWVHGIARHKIADSYRQRGRLPIPSPDLDLSAADSRPWTGELSQWIESELPKTDSAQATLHWLLREGDGESLDEIARDVDLPAPRVRQRVSRLRRHFHARWLALGAAGLVLLLGAGTLTYRALRPAAIPQEIAREPITPFERARILRHDALQRCALGAYRECIAALDEARALDPSGENASAIREARAAAARSEQPRTPPELPAGVPAVPDSNGAPKQSVPQELERKQRAPSKSAPQRRFTPSKSAPQELLTPSKPLPQKALAPSKSSWPSAASNQQMLPPDAAPAGKQFPSREPTRK